MKISAYFFMILCCFACSKNEPRKPINPKPSTTLFKEIVEESKALNKVEDAKISRFIKKDTLNTYNVSPHGFWYTYNTKIEEDNATPIAGNEVEITYNIKNLKETILYSKAALGVKKYKIDKEDFIPALQVGIKLMKIGETITFVIPSYNAFGIAGDGNKIGLNQSIISTVTLISIK
ncbi:gliding motility-associated peptidyl-prolyl isomerase GldI [Polaribacter sp.]|uniref:gliding motility-associated peptidyl-prolyl isomerase GldI n=1 Tax=Polaribacter sp. TaxID=1920175 RepID=UPI003EF3D77E